MVRASVCEREGATALSCRSLSLAPSLARALSFSRIQGLTLLSSLLRPRCLHPPFAPSPDA
eukprot:4799-Rhodomonas_salina.1